MVGSDPVSPGYSYPTISLAPFSPNMIRSKRKPGDSVGFSSVLPLRLCPEFLIWGPDVDQPVYCSLVGLVQKRMPARNRTTGLADQGFFQGMIAGN